MQDKKAFRETCKALRKLEDPDGAKFIFEKIIISEPYKKSSLIFVYISFDTEPDTRQFIRHALLEGKRMAVPYCIAGTREMLACEITSLEKDTAPNDWGILEPINPHAVLIEEIDLAIVPGLAFSKDGYRLGYGAGYYDRYFAKKRHCTLTGITYDSLLFDSLPHENHDIKMNQIITPGKEIIL